MGSAGGNSVLLSGIGRRSSRLGVLISRRVVKQPGDGNCLLHSLCHGLRRHGGKENACALRQELAQFIEQHPNLEINGKTLEGWIRPGFSSDTFERWIHMSYSALEGCPPHLEDTSVSSYCRRLAQDGCRGGAIEMAVCAQLKQVNVHVYQHRRRGGYKRKVCFDCPRATSRSIHVLYQPDEDKGHFDALEDDDDDGDDDEQRFFFGSWPDDDEQVLQCQTDPSNANHASQSATPVGGAERDDDGQRPEGDRVRQLDSGLVAGRKCGEARAPSPAGADGDAGCGRPSRDHDGKTDGAARMFRHAQCFGSLPPPRRERALERYTQDAKLRKHARQHAEHVCAWVAYLPNDEAATVYGELSPVRVLTRLLQRLRSQLPRPRKAGLRSAWGKPPPKEMLDPLREVAKRVHRALSAGAAPSAAVSDWEALSSQLPAGVGLVPARARHLASIARASRKRPASHMDEDKVALFYRFIRKREKVRLRREVLLQPRPWTTDSILANIKFCNVHRVNDRTSRMVSDLQQRGVELWRAASTPAARREVAKAFIWNAALWRRIGGVEGIQAVGWLCLPTTRDTYKSQMRMVHHRLVQIWTRGGHACTEAYSPSRFAYRREVTLRTEVASEAVAKIKMEKSYGQLLKPMSHLLASLDTIADALWLGDAVAEAQDAEGASTASKDCSDTNAAPLRWERVMAAISGVKGYGGTGFCAKEVALDLLGTPCLPAKLCADLGTYSPVGPGARRGLNRLMGREPNADQPVAQLQEEMRSLLARAQGLWPPKILDLDVAKLELHDIQFQLCEVDKYLRASSGKRMGLRPYGR